MVPARTVRGASKEAFLNFWNSYIRMDLSASALRAFFFIFAFLRITRNKHVELDFFTTNSCTKIFLGHVLSLQLYV